MQEHDQYRRRSGVEIEGVPPPITTPNELVIALNAVVGRGIGVGSLNADKLAQLRKLVDIVPSVRIGARREKLERTKRMPPERTFNRWLGARLRWLEKGEGGTHWEAEAGRLLKQLRYAAQTPREFIPKPAPKSEILRPKELDDAMVDVGLGDFVTSQLMDPVALSAKGLCIIPKPDDPDEAVRYDFTVPTALLGILRKLKHPESEEVFKTWALTQFVKTEAEVLATLRFLEELVNFTSFLDSPAHLEIWKPPEVAGRKPEILLQPFHTLVKWIEHVGRLPQVRSSVVVQRGLGRIENLIRLRYGELFRYITSLFTASANALTPNPDDFAALAVSSIVENGLDGPLPEVVARALVNQAESLGVTNLQPLAARLGGRPELMQALLAEAKKAGLIPYPEAVPEALKVLERNPWKDAAEIDFADIIKPETTDLEVYVVTGTFGPFTKGHKDLLVRLLGYLDSQPSAKEGRVFQRIVLIVPVTDVSGIPNYQKEAAQMGSIEERVTAMLLQLSEIDRQRVFITTRLQPDPAVAQTLEERALHTSNALSKKILEDLEKGDRVAGFNPTFKFALGPDELVWSQTATLAPRDLQPRKVTQHRNVIIVRLGWLLPILANHRGIAKETAAEAVILTPGTPHSSSKRVIDEIMRTRHTRAVEEAAAAYVGQHWSPEAIQKRQQEPPRLSVVPSVGTICQELIEGLN